MKKLFTLAIALVFMTGMAFAQDHEADIEQVGNNNNADVQQSAPEEGDFNYTELRQIGNNNTANITQTAFGWDGGFGFGSTTSPGMDADVRQDGNNNFLDAKNQGHNTDLFVRQIGSANEAYVGSQYANHDIDVRQRGIRNVGDVDIIPQGLVSNADVTLWQLDGNDNTAEIDVNSFGDTYDLEVIQRNGNSNEGYISVAGGPSTSFQDFEGEPVVANIFQEGSFNYANIDQQDGRHAAVVIQEKNGNTADVFQSGAGHEANVFQQGFENTAIVNQNSDQD